MTSSMRRRAAPMRWRQMAISSVARSDAFCEAIDVDVAAFELAQDGIELLESLGVARTCVLGGSIIGGHASSSPAMTRLVLVPAAN